MNLRGGFGWETYCGQSAGAGVGGWRDKENLREQRDSCENTAHHRPMGVHER